MLVFVFSKKLMDPLDKVPFPHRACRTRDAAMDLMLKHGIFTRDDHIDRYIAAKTISQELQLLCNLPCPLWVNMGSTLDIKTARNFIMLAWY